jgi:cellulose synthase/poly-beta-1,6-N-acetylglucosamine synthase-like glycosyltransferase
MVHVLFIFFLVAAGLQVVFLLAFIMVLIMRKSVPSADGPVPVSVIVCAHDEEENLRELIPMLLSQNHPQFEVIVVNDRSNDGTYDWLLEETKKDNRLRMVQVNHLPAHINGKKYGITLGIKAAQHDIVLLTDADCRPADQAWISSMSRSFDDRTQFVIGYSPYIKERGLLNLFIRFETIITAVQYISLALLGLPYMGVGRNLAYRKSFFLKVKGFNELLPVTGGDDDLFVNRHAHKRNAKVSAGFASVVFSKPKATWKNFYRQKVRHLSVGKKYRMGHRVLLGIFSLSHLATWICGLALGLTFTELNWVIPALVMRWTLLGLAVYLASRRFGNKFEIWTVPFLDFLFVIYYISTGTVALVTKKVQWRI